MRSPHTPKIKEISGISKLERVEIWRSGWLGSARKDVFEFSGRPNRKPWKENGNQVNT